MVVPLLLPDLDHLLLDIYFDIFMLVLLLFNIL